MPDNDFMNPTPDAKTAEFVRRYWSDDEAAPKHERLSQAFLHAIGDGFWLAGARLPAEQELVQATPCSLGTVQKALRTLADADVIRRRRGSGTVVADVDRPLDAPWHMRFHAPGDPARTPVPVYARVIGRTVTTKTGPWSAPLEQDGSEIVRLTRLMNIDGAFNVYNVFRARPDRFPELVEVPVAELNAKNLKELMAQTHRLIVHRVEQELSLRTASAEAAKAAGWAAAGTPVSVLSAVGYDLTGTAMYHQEYHIPPNGLTLALGSMTRP